MAKTKKTADTTKTATTAKAAAKTATKAATTATSAKAGPKTAAKAATTTKAASVASAASPPVSAPPDWTVPTIPNGYSPPDGLEIRRWSKPTEPMRAEGEDFADELRSGTTYYDDFGKRAPDPIALANAIDIAVQWDAVYDAVAPVAAYALAMRGAAWDYALGPVKKLRTAYESAVADEPALTKTWKKTTAFLGAREEPATRAAQTRAKAKRAAKKTAKAAAAGTNAAATGTTTKS